MISIKYSILAAVDIVFLLLLFYGNQTSHYIDAVVQSGIENLLEDDQ